MSNPIREPMRILSAVSRVVGRRLSYFVKHRNPVGRSFFFLVEAAGVTLFALGMLSTMAFLSAETPAEAAHRGLAKMPSECEAGFLNHGVYTCWYTISDHLFLFVVSLAVLLAGGAIIVWAQRRWFPSGRTGGA